MTGRKPKKAMKPSNIVLLQSYSAKANFPTMVKIHPKILNTADKL